MNKRRNILTCVMALAITFALSACGTSGNFAGTTSGTEGAVSDTIELTEAGETSTEEMDTAAQEGAAADLDSGLTESNVLVAYFSQTGNTEEAAQKIAEYTGGDLAKIQRAEEYDDLYEEAEKNVRLWHSEVRV